MEEKPRVYSYSRFSSDEQAKGYSLERQERRALEWCEKNGYTLERGFVDLGKSGYKGEHLKKGGALGRFLSMVKAGKIPPGSILLVEQLDRITRQNLDDASDTIRAILKAEIRIVTLAGGKEYKAGQGLGGAIDVLIALEAAHLESYNKADRLRQSWQKRLERAANGEIISKQCPGWLEVKEGRFEPIPGRVETLKLIFRLADEGMGVQSIATHLNEQGVPTWKKGGKWLKNTVHARILTSKAPLGILEINITAKPGDKPTIKEIPGYFPPVIQPEQWHRVQKSLKARTNEGGKQRAGRKGSYRNLFADVSFCGYCGARMTIMDAGTGPNGAKWRHWMVCSSARLKHGCKYHSHPYLKIENAILGYSTEIGFDTILTGGDLQPEIAAARQRVQSIRADIAGKEIQLEAEINLASHATNASLVGLLAKRLDALQGEIDSLHGALEEAEHDLARIGRTGDTIRDHLEALKTLRRKLNHKDETKMIEARRLARLAIKESVERIDFYPNGLQGRVVELVNGGLEVIDRKPGLSPVEEAQLAALLPDGHDLGKAKAEIVRGQKRWFKSRKAATTGKAMACFLVRFLNRHCRVFQRNADGCFEQVESLTAGGYTSPLLSASFSDGDFILS